MMTMLKIYAGLMCQHDGFDTIILDPHCSPHDVVSGKEVTRRPTRIFHVWIEGWEDKNIGPQYDLVQEQSIIP